MQLVQAWGMLGLEPTDDRRRIREAYLVGVRITHPDVSQATDAHERTAALRDAYESILHALDDGVDLMAPPPDHPTSGAGAAETAAAAGPTESPGDGSTSRWWRGFRPDPSGPAPGPADEPIDASVLTDDTIAIAAPANEALPFLIEACHEIGDITFLDQRAGLIQVTVGFVGEPVCYLVMSLQGRSSGVTEVFCSIESIESAPPPPIGAVTRLLVETLDALVW